MCVCGCWPALGVHVRTFVTVCGAVRHSAVVHAAIVITPLGGMFSRHASVPEVHSTAYTYVPRR